MSQGEWSSNDATSSLTHGTACQFGIEYSIYRLSSGIHNLHEKCRDPCVNSNALALLFWWFSPYPEAELQIRYLVGVMGISETYYTKALVGFALAR